MTGGQSPLFSLVVATYGRSDLLEGLVQSLAAQTCRDFEVIVVDQNPDDRVVPVLAPLMAAGDIRLQRIHSAVPSASRARNIGLKAARGRIVAFPDDDCWYEPETLAAAASHFTGADRPDGLAGRWIESEPFPGDDQTEISSAAMRRFRAGNLACITLFLDRGRVTQAGGFDERIGPGHWYAGAEETDLVLKLLAAGARMRRASDVIVHHPNDSELTVRTDRRSLHVVRTRARGTGALYAKHRLRPWIIVRGLISPLIAPPGPRLVEGMAKSFGRLEGFMKWRWSEERSATTASGHMPDTKGQAG